MARFAIEFEDGTTSEFLADSFQPYTTYNGGTATVTHVAFYERATETPDLDPFNDGFVGGPSQYMIGFIKAEGLKSIIKVPEVT